MRISLVIAQTFTGMPPLTHRGVKHWHSLPFPMPLLPSRLTTCSALPSSGSPINTCQSCMTVLLCVHFQLRPAALPLALDGYSPALSGMLHAGHLRSRHLPQA